MSAFHLSSTSIESVLVRLEAVYGKARWLARFDPMEELVSCILSQHTSDKNSFPAFTQLRTRFPDWESMAQAGLTELADCIRNAGLANQKAKSIVGCLAAINQRTGGYSLELLRTMPTLEARRWLMDLPGVGPKTASIVLCFSFGRGTIPVDTHVFRVAKRIGVLPASLNEAQAHDYLLEAVPSELAFRFHAALIQHGRNVCRAPNPLCEACWICDECNFYLTRETPAGPRRKAKLAKS